MTFRGPNDLAPDRRRDVDPPSVPGLGSAGSPSSASAEGSSPSMRNSGPPDDREAAATSGTGAGVPRAGNSTAPAGAGHPPPADPGGERGRHSDGAAPAASDEQVVPLPAPPDPPPAAGADTSGVRLGMPSTVGDGTADVPSKSGASSKMAEKTVERNP